MSRPLRVLLFRNDLRQAGSERALFEVARALDPGRFRVEIATSDDRPHDEYYAHELERLGFTIHRLHIPAEPRFRLPGRLAGYEHTLSLRRRRFGARLARQLATFDLVAPFVFEDYLILQPFLQGTEKLVVFLVSHAIQYARSPYVRAGHAPPAGLVLCDAGQEPDLAGTALDTLPRTMFPLCLDLSVLPPAHEVPEQPRDVAVFSRMEPDKPLDFFFYSLQALLRQASVMLHVFGRGDHAAYAHLLELLGIAKHVRFEGHAPDMHAALRLHQIALVWGHSIGSFFGYSTLQLASAGVPLILWNMGDRSSPEAWVPTHASVPEFTQHTALLLGSRERLAAHGAHLREEVLARRNIRHRIQELEAFLESLATPPQTTANSPLPRSFS